ncbi:probable 28S ribosomal protein S25, mitochondrial [Anneissia japonica]|uniref:probable 28S ribosomal protein S25, mitochondrial n=1 Tax=Anneissia japonica TaxID=1529436 RepID=UPI001425611D|nr:probable 28S ribosomal protein S25, mitochondrial [Anneissia japonica]
MPMIGKFPLRRTLRYLKDGKVHLIDRVQIFTITYNTFGKQSQGARDFVFYNLPQLQYNNPKVQMQTLKNLTPSPFIRCFLDGSKEVLIDIDNFSQSEIIERLNKVLGKSEVVLAAEELARRQLVNPAHFGERFGRKCMCEIPGQIPCPGVVPLPDHMRGKFMDLKAGSLKAGKGRIQINLPDA